MIESWNQECLIIFLSFFGHSCIKDDYSKEVGGLQCCVKCKHCEFYYYIKEVQCEFIFMRKDFYHCSEINYSYPGFGINNFAKCEEIIIKDIIE